MNDIKVKTVKYNIQTYSKAILGRTPPARDIQKNPQSCQPQV